MKNSHQINPPKIRFRDHIAYKQARLLILATFFLGVIFSLVQIYTGISRENRILDRTVTQVINTMKIPAAQAAFLLDRGLARDVANGLFEFQPIVGVSLVDDFGEELASLTRPMTQRNPSPISNLLFGENREYLVSLFVADPKKKNVGKILVRIDPFEFEQDFIERTFISMGYVIVSTLLLSVIIFLIFYFSVTRPLLEITAPFSKIDPAEPQKLRVSIPKGHERDEFGLVVRSVNDLLQTIDNNLIEIKKADEALRESEGRFKNFAEAAGDWFWEMDENFRYTYVVQPDQESIGVKPDHLEGKTPWEAAKGSLKEEKWADHLMILEAHLSFRNLRYSNVDDQGKVKHLSESGKPLFDPDGRFRGFRGTTTDITAQVEAEGEAARNLEMLQTVFNHMSEGINIIDSNFKIIGFNRRFIELLDIPPGRIYPGISFEEFIRMKNPAPRGGVSDFKTT